MSLITIIGRGHGGTRAISHTLMVSNVFMGEPLNRSGDLLPPKPCMTPAGCWRSMSSGAAAWIGISAASTPWRSR